MKKKAFRPPAVCPVCGEDVPPKSLACPECGADERSGWKEDAADYDGLDLADEEFDYNEYVKNEFGGGRAKPANEKLLWWLVAIGLLIVLVWGLIVAGR
jgi:hypothetical protein